MIFNGFGSTPLAAGVVFSNDDAATDFIQGNSTLRGTSSSWGGVSPGILKALADAAGAAQGPLGSSALDAFAGAAKSYVSSIDSLQKFGIGGRSPAQDTLYYNAMKSLKDLIPSGTAKIAKANKQDRADAAAAGADIPAIRRDPIATTGTGGGSSSGSNAITTAGDSNLVWYLAGAGGFLVLAVGGYFALRKKQPKLAGYRRRRSRR